MRTARKNATVACYSQFSEATSARNGNSIMRVLRGGWISPGLPPAGHLRELR